MEQDQHERRLAKLQKRMATDIGDFVVIAAAAFGIGFGRYLAEYKGVEIMYLFNISRDLAATMTAISAIGFILLMVITAAVAETTTQKHRLLLLMWSLIYCVCASATCVICFLGVPLSQEHSLTMVPPWKKFCILASFVFQDISLDIVQSLIISWIIVREKHTERAIASYGILYPIGSLVASALFLKSLSTGCIFTIAALVLPMCVLLLGFKTGISKDSSISSTQKFFVNSLYIMCPDTRIKNLQIWSSITYPAVFILRSELPTLLRELDARKGDFYLEKSEYARFIVTTVSDSCSSFVALVLVALWSRWRLKTPALAVQIVQTIVILVVFQFPSHAVIFVATVVSGPSAIFIMLLPFIIIARARNEIKEERQCRENAVTDVAAVMIAYKVGVTLLIILLDHIITSLNSQASSDYDDDSVFSKQSHVSYYLMLALFSIGSFIFAKLLRVDENLVEHEGRLITRDQSDI
ncbi:unnamed protein product [Oikopleura dioica]|uniref:Uncharacterized protein n=1 Tax=Oikopleura dioica TaxID=34765 RepID=E4YGA5_OIKDI|nr:unnamed protein product [Oikopleura dioica]